MILLLLLELLAFGLFLPRLGFYLDDWPLLETMSAGGRLGAAGAWVRNGGLWTRPLEILHYSFFFLIGGLDPLSYHLLLFALCVAEGWLLFLLLERLIGSKELAWLAAALAMLHPNRAVFQLWFSNSPQPLAHVLVLASMLCHLRWVDGKGARWVAASLSLYLLALLSYESVAFMPLMLVVGIAPKLLAPYLLPMGLGLGWQWFGAKLLLRHANPKSGALALTPGYVLKAFGAGFECVFNRTVHICAKGLSAAAKTFPPGLWLLWAVAVPALAAAFPIKAEPRRTAARAGLLALAVFVAGYTPYALSGSYMPQIYGVMSRTNALGAWAGGLLIAALLALLTPRARRAGAALILGAFLWTDWATGLDWVRSWELQRDILAGLAPAAKELPSGSTILLADSPHFAGYAPVFDATYDFNSALRLKTGRFDIVGNVLNSKFRFEKNEAVELGDAGTVRYPYRTLYAYDYGRRALERVSAANPRYRAN